MSPQASAERQIKEGLSTSSHTATAGIWQAWFDGTAVPNPGKIGIGVVLMSPGGVRIEKCLQISPNGCSNEAEFHALIAALKLAHAEGARHLVLRGDSTVAIRYVLDCDRTDVARLTALVREAQSWLPRFDEVRLVWIPRHRNIEADRLARRSLDLPERPSAVHKAKRRRR